MTSAPIVANGGGNDADRATRGDVKQRGVSANADDVEATLTRAIDGATKAGRWDVVAQLARELEARRLARLVNVVKLDDVRSKGK